MVRRGRRESVARQIAMTVRRHLDVVLDANAAERRESLDRSAIEPRLVLGEQLAQQLRDEVEAGLDRDDDAGLQRARQAQVRVRPRRLALLARLVGEMPARVVHLKAEQVTEPAPSWVLPDPVMMPPDELQRTSSLVALNSLLLMCPS